MSNLFKSNYVVNKDETRVIDSNDLIASRLQQLNEMAVTVPEYGQDDGNYDGFKAGLNAEQLQMLLSDSGDPEQEGYEGEFSEGIPMEEYQEDGGYPQAGISMEEIQQEAGSILDGAREEAENIVARANEEAEEIRNSFKEQGYSQGYEQGHSEGLKVIEEREKELQEYKEQLDAEYEKKLEEMEPLLVDTITDIFEHVFHVSLSSNREIMLNLLHDTVRNIEGGKNFIIHVSKNDYEYISERRDQLTEGLGSTDTIEVVEDLTLRQSECFVESEGGIYDCGIGTELELLKKELMLLSYQKS
ncbi:MAG: hypothetical protein K6E53_05595 [Lachnospiraceae bacterium]|nr:hypothetical protein [Lachnospiraceae bacterium]